MMACVMEGKPVVTNRIPDDWGMHSKPIDG